MVLKMEESYANLEQEYQKTVRAIEVIIDKYSDSPSVKEIGEMLEILENRAEGLRKKKGFLKQNISHDS